MRKTNKRLDAVRLRHIENIINYEFNNQNLLKQAFTHSSYANEHRNEEIHDNERLEFLGDAILDLIVSEYLFNKYPDMLEGDLSKIRASIVCEASLAKISKEIQVGEYILLGKGEEMTGGRTRASILADAFEAITGAIFQDSGFDSVRDFIHGTIIEELKGISIEELYTDYKTLLQENIQKESSEPISYEVVGEEGPDHDKYFYVMVSHGQDSLGKGVGKSKKEAEQNAAKIALMNLKNK